MRICPPPTLACLDLTAAVAGPSADKSNLSNTPMKRHKPISLLLVLLAAQTAAAATNLPIFINEWMASNLDTVTNPASGQPDPWVELCNAGDVPLDLSGWFLSSSPINPAQ